MAGLSTGVKMRDEKKTKKQIKNELVKLGQRIAGSEALENEDKQAEDTLQPSEEKYRSLVNNIKLGIFRSTPGPSGKFIEVNLAMEEITGYSREELLSMNVSDLYMRPEERGKVVAELATWTGKTTRELNFRKKDGAEMVVADTKVAVKDNTGRVLYFDGIIEDITELKRTEEVLKQSEEETRRLAQETAIIAEIGRIINSTLDIDEVYGRFAEEVHKLIPFDRIAIDINNFRENTFTAPYISGIELSGYETGNAIPMAGTPNEVVTRTKSGLIIEVEDVDWLSKRFPQISIVYNAGLRSMMAVPLISKDVVIGVLFLSSRISKAYKERDLRLAESIALQIAGAIANAQLLIERKRAEEARRKTEEHFRGVIEDIFRFVPEALLVFTDKLSLFKHNKAFRDIVQEYSGKLNYTEEELAETILKEVKNRIAGGDRTEIRIPKKQG